MKSREVVRKSGLLRRQESKVKVMKTMTLGQQSQLDGRSVYC